MGGRPLKGHDSLHGLVGPWCGSSPCCAIYLDEVLLVLWERDRRYLYSTTQQPHFQRIVHSIRNAKDHGSPVQIAGVMVSSGDENAMTVWVNVRAPWDDLGVRDDSAQPGLWSHPEDT